MKHNIKITAILLLMFIITQFIGLYVVNYYNVQENKLPAGMEPPTGMSPASTFSQFIIAFIIAVFLFLFLIKFKAEFILKLWFFLVVAIAMLISFGAILPKFNYSGLIFFSMALIIAFFKIYKRYFLIHNLTELFVYPGIAAIFVSLLAQWDAITNLVIMISLLVLISIYDLWAVWKSGLMQKMAKYHINTLKIFPGFFIPYMSKKLRLKISKLKKSEIKNKKIKVNVAILGGGDVVFPIITAGVVLVSFSAIHSLFVIAGATLGIGYLFFFAKKKKFYPAMPFITAGILLGLLASYLIL